MRLPVHPIVAIVSIALVLFVSQDVLAASDERPDAWLEWFTDDVISFTDTGIIRVHDEYTNQDPDKIETLSVSVYVEERYEEAINVELFETDADTGIFEGTMFFSNTEPSSGHRLHVINSDIVTAEYSYATDPESDFLDIGVGDEITITAPDTTPSLKSQVYRGLSLEEITCSNPDHVLIKRTNEKLACVESSTAEKLGWKLIHHVSTSDISTQSQPYDYEDVCGFSVTDEMRLNAIYEQSYRFTRDGIPYFELNPGKFAHIELAQNYEPDDPHLNYWFELENGKQVAFRIGACDIDGSSISRFEKRN